MDAELTFSIVDATTVSPSLDRIRALLATRGLSIDAGVEVFVAAWASRELVACAGLDGNLIKCVAIVQEHEGESLLPSLISELTYVALDRGHTHLFLYTPPRNTWLFEGCGFHTVAHVPGQVAMMENTPRGIHAYVEQLSHLWRNRPIVGSVVVNANPMTRGHQYLLKQAAMVCDVVHVFVVSEDRSFFPFSERLALVRAAVAEMPERDRILVHPGTEYIVSRATFPTYFIKEQGQVESTATAIDLVIFRTHIAPALGITHRFVGTEPFCPVTRQYNADMHRWLEDEELTAPPVQVVEVERTQMGERAISATEVRRLLHEGNVDDLRDLVPRPTFELLRTEYAPRYAPSYANAS